MRHSLWPSENLIFKRFKRCKSTKPAKILFRIAQLCFGFIQGFNYYNDLYTQFPIKNTQEISSFYVCVYSIGMCVHT